MPKSKKPRKKFQSKKNQKQLNQGGIYIREYYQLAFRFFIENYPNDIKTEMLEFRYKLRSDFHKEKNIVPKCGDDAFNFLKQYLSYLEYIQKEIISTHSPIFWIHLYRRTGLGLIVNDNELASAMTLNIVRNFMEIAFLKFGGLDKNDLCLSKELSHNEVLDGLFYKSHKASGYSNEEIKQIWEEYRKRDEIVLKDYKMRDHTNLYLLESIAYEYWKATANMRSIAKGGELIKCDKFFWKEERTDALNQLISSYDKRISIGFKYLPTAKGLLTYSKKDSDNKLFYTVYNDKLELFSEIIDDKQLSEVIT
ncbi:TPA: hypothetical protein NU797_001822, partial [Acinetobacter baumannii]|nr:hypothetical protein [Acinetobacter baumannii]